MTGPAEKGGLTRLASRALGWSFLSTALTRLGLIGFGVLLARLLGPREFGTAAVALVTLLAVLSFNELGVSLAIVRWPEEPDDIAPTVSTISVVSSLLLYVALFAAAPKIAATMGAPAATPVIRVLGLSIITNGMVAVPAALLQRYFRQGRKTIADQVHGWLGAVISVGLAWGGFGAMSIAIGQAAGAVAGGILIMIFAPLPLRFGFDRAKARKLFKFGLPLAGSSIVVFLIGNVDNFITGHVLGATVLGFYVLAWNLASWPVNMFSLPVRTVAPAFFSRLQRSPLLMRNGFVLTSQLLGCVTLPVCLVIAGLSLPLVVFLYGPQWSPAAAALTWLALLAALRILFELSYDYFVVLAKSRVVFTVQLVWLVALIPALLAGARTGGLRGVAIAGFAVAALVVLPWYLYELSKVGIGLRHLAVRLRVPFATAVVTGAGAVLVSKVVKDYLGDLVICGMATLAVIGLLGFRSRHAVVALRSVDAPYSRPANAAADAPRISWPARPTLDLPRVSWPEEPAAGPLVESLVYATQQEEAVS